MNLSHHEVIQRPLLTEKLDMDRENNNVYAFAVDRRANKVQIRSAVEALFDVKVTSVRTQVVPGKPKRLGMNFGRRPAWKKALVTLAEGNEIDFVEGVSMPEEN